MATEADLYVGKLLDGRWQVEGSRASGHFSVVLEGTDTHTRRPVAVKILKIGQGAEAHEEFDGEISLLGDLIRFDRVVDLLGHGRESLIVSPLSPAGASAVQVPIQFSYLVLELADGYLTELLVSLDQVSWQERLSLFRDVVKGIHQMHLKRMVNRDLKSENVLLFSERFSTAAKVADLGRARRTSDPARNPSEAYLTGRGDFRFAPPELLWSQGSDSPSCWAAVDLFHLGSVLFELVVGYGLTSAVLPEARMILEQMAGADPGVRQASYQGNLPTLRAKMVLAWEAFDAEVPADIRPHASKLLRQLTDPDPLRRAARILGRPLAPDKGLEWLLRRVDIISLTHHKTIAQASALSRHKDRKAG